MVARGRTCAQPAKLANRLETLKCVDAMRLLAAAAFALILSAPTGVHADARFDFGIQAFATYDDNVTRAEGDQNVLSDYFYGGLATADGRFLLTENIRLRLGAELGGQAYHEYSGLSFGSAGARADVQYRASGEFGVPIISLFGRFAYEEYNSDLRDGYRYAVGLSAGGDLTDRLAWFTAFSYNLRDASSVVFDNRDFSVRANLDYFVSRRNTLYTSVEYRIGDIVSTALPSLQYIDIAKAIVRDDAFTDTDRFAYKIDATTWIFALGYNFAFSANHSLDASWHYAYATPNDVSSNSWYESIHYKVNQYSLAYMVRF